MNLDYCLRLVSKRHFFSLCGMTYVSAKRFDKRTFKRLEPSIKLGIKKLISQLYTIQSLTNRYDLDHTIYSLKVSGVKLKPFFKEIDVPKSFYANKYVKRDNEAYIKTVIKDKVCAMIIELLDFSLNKNDPA